MPSKRNKAYLVLLTTSILWGFAVPIIKKSFESTTPLLFLSYRFIIVILLATVPFIIYQRKRAKIKKPLKLLCIGLLSFPLNLLLLFYGLQRTSAMEAALLAALNPILFNLGGFLVLKEKITKKEKLGLSVSILGTLFIIFEPIFNNGSSLNFQSHLSGNMLIVLGGIIGVSGLIWAKEERKNYTPFQISYFSFLAAFLTFIILAIFVEPAFTQNFMAIFSKPAIWGISYMAIFGSLIAYSCLIYGQSLIEISEASLFIYLQPLFAAPLAVIWLHETIKTPFIIGAGLIVFGVFLTEYRK